VAERRTRRPPAARRARAEGTETAARSVRARAGGGADPPGTAGGGAEADGMGLLSLPPTVARMTLVASARAGLWTVGMGVTATRRLVDAARTNRDVNEVLRELQDDAVRSARTLLGVDALERMLGDDPPAEAQEPEPGAEEEDPSALRERGRELLAQSAEIRADPEIHPAFESVLDQLASDEARILRLLATEGPQPVVDVMAAGPLGIGTRQVADTLSMIAQEAGVLHAGLVPVYIDNLIRLGLVRKGLEPLDDDAAYELLQTQPDVADAEEEAASGATRPRVEKGALALTDFGRRFCEVCLPLDEG
jgi:hypothetical protein